MIAEVSIYAIYRLDFYENLCVIKTIVRFKSILEQKQKSVRWFMFAVWAARKRGRVAGIPAIANLNSIIKNVILI